MSEAEWKEMSIVETINYSKGVIDAVGEGLIKVIEARRHGLILQKKVGEKFFVEVKDNQDEIMRAFLFSVKKEFRDTYISLIQKIIKVAESLGV